MRFFCRREPKQDGRSAESAFRLPAVGSGSAVPLEYAALEKLLAKKGAIGVFTTAFAHKQYQVGKSKSSFSKRAKDAGRSTSTSPRC